MRKYLVIFRNLCLLVYLIAPILGVELDQIKDFDVTKPQLKALKAALHNNSKDSWEEFFAGIKRPYKDEVSTLIFLDNALSQCENDPEWLEERPAIELSILSIFAKKEGLKVREKSSAEQRLLELCFKQTIAKTLKSYFSDNTINNLEIKKLVKFEKILEKLATSNFYENLGHFKWELEKDYGVQFADLLPLEKIDNVPWNTTTAENLLLEYAREIASKESNITNSQCIPSTPQLLLFVRAYFKGIQKCNETIASFGSVYYPSNPCFKKHPLIQKQLEGYYEMHPFDGWVMGARHNVAAINWLVKRNYFPKSHRTAAITIAKSLTERETDIPMLAPSCDVGLDWFF